MPKLEPGTTMKRIMSLIMAPIVGIGMAIVVIAYLSTPIEPPKPADYDPAKITTIISEDKAETAARDAVDVSYQRNGYEKGAARGGALGSIDLVYISSDGTGFAVNKQDGALGTSIEFTLDNAKLDHYYGKLVLNYGNMTKPEYGFTIDAQSGNVLQMGVID